MVNAAAEKACANLGSQELQSHIEGGIAEQQDSYIPGSV
jgi:hypothetical protein